MVGASLVGSARDEPYARRYSLGQGCSSSRLYLRLKWIDKWRTNIGPSSSTVHVKCFERLNLDNRFYPHLVRFPGHHAGSYGTEASNSFSIGRGDYP